MNISVKNFEILKEKLIDEKDLILVDECIKFMKKLEAIKSVITRTDEDEIIKLIINIVRIYLMIQREYWKDSEEIEAIKNDIQGTLSTLFRVDNIKKSSTLIYSPAPMMPGSDSQEEFMKMIRPFISFVETNIYYSYVTAYNELIRNLHSRFCEVSAMAAGIIKEKKEALPELPSQVGKLDENLIDEGKKKKKRK